MEITSPLNVRFVIMRYLEHRIPAVTWTQSGIIDAQGCIFKAGVLSWLNSDAVEWTGILRK